MMKIFHFKLDGDYVRSLEERNKLFEDNINLVHFIISRYFNYFLRKYPYLKEDLFQEGYIGLHKATCCFDESKGKFSTIAFPYISGHLKRFTTGYVKKHYRNDIDSFEKCIYRDNYGEEIRIEDRLAGNENVDIENVRVIRSCIKRSEIKDIQKIVCLREKGYTQQEISKVLGTSQTSIYRRLKKLKTEINILGK
ncbi:TPA: sigma-70 family RNA polymerase sigma factor [Clostridioides difficile]|nr:sigma-70 family RNA polymerase sigma factor [Clostridioides difficile]MBH7748264.1 sigma-70 family RNA polymerase sigma factor [Clostridioides difficile]MCI9897655.1 sigma-70 family RNA polymerase sigma factor [Clostridioides difficile]MCI9970587.1 sigma-70 family RNA polymerase sigma factor [Clostridioides difficile]MCJ0167658.1 sigma-70 family RNA polymerase sigma factor [Clostridioides difficile]